MTENQQYFHTTATFDESVDRIDYLYPPGVIMADEPGNVDKENTENDPKISVPVINCKIKSRQTKMTHELQIIKKNLKLSNFFSTTTLIAK